MAKPKARAMTNAERSKLLVSPYIRNATPHSIQFTEEAKWLIWEKATQGKSCIKVLLEDLKLPPIDHLYDIAHRLPANLKKELDRKGTFERLRKGPSYSKPLAREEEERLREKLILDSQEMEFLKKLPRRRMGEVRAMLESKPSVVFETIRETLADPNSRLTVSRLCEAAEVSKSGYYLWLSAEGKRAAREADDESEFGWIKKAYEYRGYDKGGRGIFMRLQRMGHPMNLKKIRRLMRKFGLKCPIRKANTYRRMQKAMKTDNYASNILERNFTGLGPRKALLTDITYIPFKGRFIYVSPVIDACTKEVLAHRISTSLAMPFVKGMLDDLKRDYGDELSPETLIHSDQGCHYTSKLFIETVESMELIRSMSRRGNCWDNAPQESFFGHMKDEIGARSRPAKRTRRLSR